MSNFKSVMSPDEKIRQLTEQKMARDARIEALRASKSTVLENARLSMVMESQDAEVEKSIEKKDKLSELATKRKDEVRQQEAFSLESRMMREGSDACFETALVSIVYNALPYNDDVKETLTLESISEVIFETYDLLIETCNKTNRTAINKDNILVENIKRICEATCKKASKRISKKAVEENDEFSGIDFELDEEEVDSLIKDISDLDIEQIEELVKNKVVKVVEDEQKANEAKAKSMQDIEDAIAEKEPAGDAGITESAEIRILNNKLNAIRSNFGSTVFESLFMVSVKDIQDEAVSEGMNVSQEDLVDAGFAKAVIRYTTLETVNTLGMINFNSGNIAREFSRAILKSLR